MLKPVILIVLLMSVTMVGQTQDSLPRFSAKHRSGKVILGWNNPFRDVVLINIQRSNDSLKGFKTILGVADPTSVSNGFLDAKAPDTRQYYRLFVQREAGVYFFTTALRPVADTSKAVVVQRTIDPMGTELNQPPAKMAEARTKKLSGTLPLSRDSVKAEAPPAEKIFTPSVYVYSNPQGHVVLVLPVDKSQVYTLKFYKEDGTPVFTMNKIRESFLTIDKTNFIQSGWFRFELYENNLLKEKHKIFIPRDR